MTLEHCGFFSGFFMPFFPQLLLSLCGHFSSLGLSSLPCAITLDVSSQHCSLLVFLWVCIISSVDTDIKLLIL
jgi:hypothetical protein